MRENLLNKLETSYFFFRFRAKLFQQGCQNCILRVQWNFLDFKKKRDHVYYELAESADKSLHTERRMSFRT